MKTICFNNPAAWLLAGLATLMVAASVPADDAGIVRYSDFGSDAESDAMAADTDADLVIRGASELRRRNAQTTQALRRMLQQQAVQQTSAQRPVRQVAAQRPTQQARPVAPQGHPVQRVSHEGAFVPPPAVGCAPDVCCPATCAAPAGWCRPVSCAPQTCCPPVCCAPQACGAPSCGCPSGACCCPPPGCCAPGESCCPNSCDACGAGHYRISDTCPLCGGQGCSACRGGRAGGCSHGHDGGGCPICDSTSCLNNNCCADFLSEQAVAHRARNRQASANFNQYVACRMGYFIPSGNGGTGSPIFGHYEVVYPVDSGYFDDRDGDVYAAQGYGGAVSVPLAPIVNHTYNYGWGIPSSRLTPVSNTRP